jgi:glycosyltransferase involved in cell wall biosynthesis
MDPIVALFGPGALADRLAVLGVPTACLPVTALARRAGRYAPNRGLRAAASAIALLPAVLWLAALARRHGADLLHTNGTKAHFLGGPAGRLAHVPVVWHLHDFPPDGVMGRAFRAVLRRFPVLLIANSAAIAASVAPDMRGAARLATIYNPIDLARFNPGVARGTPRRELGLPRAVEIIGMAAHLTPWKGHRLFLEIARALVDAGVRAHFVIAGGAIYETAGHVGYAAQLEKWTTELGLSSHVTFLGARDDMPEILAGLDVLVHCPTAPEPFGRVLAEAMAVGRPLVAARCGGISEVVEDGVTGVLVRPGDVDGFVTAIARLLDDLPLRERMGQAGRRRAEALFGVDRHVAAVLEAYRSILAAPPVASSVSA